MQHPETVTVKGADGNPLIINKDDYNEETHGKLMKDDPGKQERQEAPGQTGAPVQRTVAKEGKRFYVVSATNGTRLEGFEPAGYDTEAAAWSAITAPIDQSTVTKTT